MSRVAYAPARSTQKSAPRPTAKVHIMGDAAAQGVHRLIGDRLADTLETIRAAIGAVNRSTYEAGSRDRVMARALVQQAWSELAVAARLLAEPAPRFRPAANGPRPVVRRQVDESVADFRPVAMPARLVEVAS